MRAGLGIAPCDVRVCEGSYHLTPNAPDCLKNPQFCHVDQTLESQTNRTLWWKEIHVWYGVCDAYTIICKWLRTCDARESLVVQLRFLLICAWGTQTVLEHGDVHHGTGRDLLSCLRGRAHRLGMTRETWGVLWNTHNSFLGGWKLFFKQLITIYLSTAVPCLSNQHKRGMNLIRLLPLSLENIRSHPSQHEIKSGSDKTYFWLCLTDSHLLLLKWKHKFMNHSAELFRPGHKKSICMGKAVLKMHSLLSRCKCPMVTRPYVEKY